MKFFDFTDAIMIILIKKKKENDINEILKFLLRIKDACNIDFCGKVSYATAYASKWYITFK